MPQQQDPAPRARTPEATAAERRIYGDLLPDVQYLRDRGLLVARFKGQYRVGNDVLSAAELRARANELRKAAPPAAAKPAASVTAAPRLTPAAPQPNYPITNYNLPVLAQHAVEQSDPPTAEDPNKFAKLVKERPAAPEAACGCGRPNTHMGRCWARRAQTGANLVVRVQVLERQVADLVARLARAGVPE